MEFVVDSPETLAQLRRPGTKAKTRRIRLRGPLADERIETALNDNYYACGCRQGSVAVMAALITSVALGITYGFEGPLIWWRIGLYMAGAALFGKLCGLAYSRIRLHSIYRQLEWVAAQGQRETTLGVIEPATPRPHSKLPQ
jgi:hypothetical protein